MLPVAWDLLASAPSDAARDDADQANAGVLGFLLREIDLRATLRSGDERLEVALAPIRAKLDMIADLLARFAYSSVALPPCHEILLGERQIAWHSTSTLGSGDWLRIKIYFDATFREPVVLYAQVTDAPRAGDDGAGRIAANLVPVPDQICSGLTRLALLTQRQQHRPRPQRR